MPEKLKYFIIYKPYGVLCQFKKEGEKKVLGDLFSFPKDVYPIGRLDEDSEGLLLLSNDKKLNHLLLNPLYKHKRTYLVQVEGIIAEESKKELEQGVQIKLNKKNYSTLPAAVNIISEPINLPKRIPPIRFRKTIPTSWLKLTLCEGKNRQVRRMMATVGFPALRLIRIGIENLSINDMKPGEVKELNRIDIYKLLNVC